MTARVESPIIPAAQEGSGRRILASAYGIATYVMFLGVFLYAIGFVGNVLVPESIDSGAAAPFGTALIINLALLAVFALQHSVMARPAFKRWWTKYVPASVERNTYVLATNFAFILLFVYWQPMTGVVWSVETPALEYALYGLFGLGWLTVLCSTFMINHFELFGLQQALQNMLGKAHSEHRFKVPLLYNFVRHPIQMGFLIAFWATPHMTVGHLVFSIMTTGYILVALVLEERDLIAQFGDQYRTYRKQVAKLCPVSRYKG